MNKLHSLFNQSRILKTFFTVKTEEEQVENRI